MLVQKYKILEVLGAGGMGKVYKGLLIGQSGFQRPIVLKQLRDAEEPGHVRLFVDEARRYAVLDHENIGRIFDFETVDGQMCIVLEYIDGWSLVEYLERHACCAGCGCGCAVMCWFHPIVVPTAINPMIMHHLVMRRTFIISVLCRRVSKNCPTPEDVSAPRFSAHSVAVSAGCAVPCVTRTATSSAFCWSIVCSVPTLLLSISELERDQSNQPWPYANAAAHSKTTTTTVRYVLLVYMGVCSFIDICHLNWFQNLLIGYICAAAAPTSDESFTPRRSFRPAPDMISLDLWIFNQGMAPYTLAVRGLASDGCRTLGGIRSHTSAR